MKRFAKTVLVLCVLFSLGYLGYKELKKTDSSLGRVHVGADSAIKIGIHEIKETLVLDALTSPRYYFNRVRFSGSDDKDTPDKGIDLMPYDLVFFTLPNVKNTLFCTFEIKDPDAFDAYATLEIERRSASVENTSNGEYSFAKIDKSKMALAWNSEMLVVAISTELKLTALHPVFRDVLIDGKTISDSGHKLVKALASHNDHIVLADNNSHITVNFEDGKALIAGNIITGTPQKYQQEITAETIENPSFQLYFDANFKNSLNKREIVDFLSSATFFQKNDLNLKELVNRTNGFFSLAINGTVTQTDTIVTYGYDDNFEKVEERSLRDKQVPKIHINLGAENQSLKEYLVRQNAVAANGVFKPFPLYNLFVKEGPMHTVFETDKDQGAVREEISSSFFGCLVDFQKLNNDLDLPQLRNYFANLEKMELFAAQKQENLVIVNGELTAANSKVNILSQLVPEKRLDSVQ